MDKVFGTDYQCQVCGRVPSLGWIYVCSQDSALSYADVKARKKLRKIVNRIAPNELDLLGFDKSVVKAAAEGFYTDKQLETLKSQKAKVKAVIEATQREKERLKSKNGVHADALAARLTRIDESANSEPDERKMTLVGDKKAQAKAKTRFTGKINQPCEWRVCHTCRPFSRDRSFISFEAAFAEDVPQVAQWMPEFMPVASAELLRNMDWERHTSSVGAQEEADDDSVYAPGNGHPNSPASSRSGSSNGFRHSLEDSFDKMIHDKRTLQAVTAANPEKMEEDGFNLELWKAMMNRVQDEASTTRLPGKDSDDSLKSIKQNGHMEEEQVEGGVVLTEEAMEMKTPDLIMSV